MRTVLYGMCILGQEIHIISINMYLMAYSIAKV